MGANVLRDVSSNLLREFYGQESNDPFLTLVTISDDSFGTLYFVNDQQDMTSNSQVYTAFPMKITLPTDDGETLREAQIEFDNVSRELIDEIRSVTSPIDCNIKMVLASNPDYVEIEIAELKIKDVTYNGTTMQARLFMDDFLNTELTSEKYTPQNFPGLFA